MKRSLLTTSFLALLVAGYFLVSSFSPSSTAVPGTTVDFGKLAVWSTFDGAIEARSQKSVMSQFRGHATIVDLVPDAAHVSAGDILVKFDASQVERDLVKIQQEYELADQEFLSLTKARLPMEKSELELQALDTRAACEAEKQYLQDSISLMAEDLVSEQEVERQRVKTQQLEKKLETYELKLKLTKEHYHPAEVEKARARLASLKQQLDYAQEQFDSCVVTAPADGIVVHKPLHVGGEWRKVRVGDGVYRSQPFMYIPDMSDLLVRCFVPEPELSKVEEGRECIVTPLSYPDLQLKAHVEKVGLGAEFKPGTWGGQKYFPIIVTLDDIDERLRTDMTVKVKVFVYENDHVLLVPRSAIEWKNGLPYCTVRKGRHEEERELTLGQANLTDFEVKEGLTSGEFVVIP
ncbi:MAG: efflux RND transporter periplasmic adaptor subunit [Verrucomicrobia bacterium]|nr:efflux RND transporter periplasmic adaptor subunit [Verrucomicrobiota bacterium]